MQKHVNLVDLVKSFPTNIYLQNLASIQKRTSPVKFAHLAEKSGKGSISSLSTKVGPDEEKNPFKQEQERQSAEFFAENFRDRDRRFDGKERAVRELLRAKEAELGVHKKSAPRTALQHPSIFRRRVASAVWTATIASKDAFFSIFGDLQDLHSFAPLQSQILQIFRKFFRENLWIFSDFCKILRKF